MPASLVRGRCVLYDEPRSGKLVFGVVLEVLVDFRLLVARGTTREHDGVIATVEPGTVAAFRWTPPLTATTRFHTWDFRIIDAERVRKRCGLCDDGLMNALSEEIVREAADDPTQE
jgi:hypothetical protein